MSELQRAWDVLLAITFSMANQTFVEAQAADLIPRFGRNAYRFATGAAQTVVVVSAKVAGWRMLEARGDLAIVQIVLARGSLAYSGREVDLSRFDFKVTVPLKSLEMETEEGASYTLTLDFTDSRTVAVPKLNALLGKVPRSDLIKLNAVLTDFFFDSLCVNEVDLVRLDATLLSDGRKWLAPKAVSCSAVTCSPGVGALGLLVSTVNTPSKTAPVLASDMVPEDVAGIFSLSNEILTKFYAAPAFAKTLGITLQSFAVKPGNPFVIGLNGPVTIENASLTTARAFMNKGNLQIDVTGLAKFWTGAQVAFDIKASYEVAIGGKGQMPKMVFRRLTREQSHSVQVHAAAKAVTLGNKGLHASRAEELLDVLMDAVAPARLGGPIALDFLAGIKWPFGRQSLPKAVLAPGALHFVYDTR